jgi:SEC-C motif-containing protein
MRLARDQRVTESPEMPCPCGSGRPFDHCCGPYLAGTAAAPTAEALMRSRYTAYVRQQIDYLMATHDPETVAGIDRASIARWARESTWLGLEVLAATGGGPGDAVGTVEFAARWREGDQEHTHREHSTFRRLHGRWVYVAGTRPKPIPFRAEAKPRPNEQCPCGSGKKYKRCHGA